ncbi:VOC family protein [Psychromarinibacter sp. C21-152]|uniref:VOC family protein n=1 Tax=Psychromarinibacter sediminicola TaxID=3033385 RepID=A0AAE3T7W0_9RHOB|nr:VOC family protein [Psychromarinibacter sediminicola]MDF0600592.1 VOC family protein [Psychromarinibacter sediminicola]
MTGHVTGIGGLFFRAADPAALKAWYATHLGIDSSPVWPQAAGPTVFAPFAADTDYWPADRQWMLNLRVTGLDALIASLQASGIAVETRPEEWDHPEVGRFARIVDPEGNNVELWEPPEA